MGLIKLYKNNLCAWGVWKIEENVSELIHHARDLRYFLSVIDQFKSEERKKQWLAVRILTDVLEKRAVIEYTDQGKPIITNGFISISHSHDYIAVMVSRSHEVGIDLQKLQDKVLRIAPKFMKAAELELAGKDLIKTTSIWCMKEALYKLYGDNSPYFKDDYLAKQLTEKWGDMDMVYGNETRSYRVALRHYHDYVVAFVSD